MPSLRLQVLICYRNKEDGHTASNPNKNKRSWGEMRLCPLCGEIAGIDETHISPFKGLLEVTLSVT